MTDRDLGVVEGAAGVALDKMTRDYVGVTHPFGFVSRDEAYALARAYRALVADREALLERIRELEDGGLCSAESRSGGDS